MRDGAAFADVTKAVAQQRLGELDVAPVEVFDLALFDLDGVVYVGPDAVPGAAEAIAAGRARGLRPCYVTNNASRTPDTVADHLTRLGVSADVADVVTSAQVGAALLAKRLSPGSAVLVVGGTGLRVALTDAGLVPVGSMDDRPVAVAQGFSPDIDWRLLAEGTRAVRAGLHWLATNLDPTVPTPHGPAPGNGALVRLVAQAAGREPDEIAGKPAPQAFLEAANRYAAQRPLVIGDRLDTDLEGACAAGMAGLAVLTGISGATDLILAPRGMRPTFIGADLEALLQPHPAAVVDADGSTCRKARVSVVDGDLVVEDDGADGLDLLRAGCALAWSVADRSGAAVRANGLLEALGRVTPGASWAR